MLWIRIGFSADPVPGFGSMRIRMRIRILDFDEQKLKKFTVEKQIPSFFATFFSPASIKGVQTTQKYLHPQKRTRSTPKLDLYPQQYFLYHQEPSSMIYRTKFTILYLRRRQAGCPCGGRVRKCHGPSWRPGAARWSFDHSAERLLSPCKENRYRYYKILLEIKSLRYLGYFLSAEGFNNFWNVTDPQHWV